MMSLLYVEGHSAKSAALQELVGQSKREAARKGFIMQYKHLVFGIPYIG